MGVPARVEYSKIRSSDSSASFPCLHVPGCGNDKETAIIDLAELIIKKTGSKTKIVHLPPLKEGDNTRSKQDTTKMRALLKRPMTSLDEGLDLLIKFKKLLKN